MKAIMVTCAMAALCFFTGIHNSVLGFIGIGSAQYGITAHDPLGTPSKIHQTMKRAGFDGELGALNKPRTMVYKHEYDSKLYPDLAGAIIVTVGDEEYIQKIEGVFFGTQHGYSPQKPTMVEQQMVSLWRSVGGPKTDFKRVEDKPFNIPWTPKFGKAFSFPQHHMESKFTAEDVKGLWAYEEGTPMEIIRLELK